VAVPPLEAGPDVAVAAAAGALLGTAAGIDDVVDAASPPGAGAPAAVVAGPLASTVGALDACFDPEEQAPVKRASATRTAPALRETTPLSSLRRMSSTKSRPPG
jgi:hypothetical protein